VLHDAQFEPIICPDSTCLERAIRDGVGAVLLAEEGLAEGQWNKIIVEVAQQPPWSDLPILLLARHGADSPTVSEAINILGNVTLLERPLRPATLLSAVRTALKARKRQYQVRAHLEEQAKTQEALRDADRRKDEFLATLAHELRNPLAPIRNSMHILRLTGCNEPAMEQVCDMMERQVGQLVRLVDDLMEVSRITRGKVELRMEPVEVAAVIRSAVEASRPLIDDAGHQLAISLPSEPLMLFGDPMRLSQVFSNLLNNASKYMQPGGQIWLTARRDGDDVVLSVRDTGIGIDTAMLPHIFEMFTQVDRSKRQAQGGLGIGLTLVKTLVEMHHGHVEARSGGLERGSEFLVRLPLSKTGEGRDRKPHKPDVPRLQRQRVLVVDDNRDAATSLSQLLEILGLQVSVAHDGPTALQCLASDHPSVVLLDIGMPGMDGYEVARRMRRLPEGRHVVLIALTGWGQEEDRHRTQDAGFDHHLLKPANIDALKSIFWSLQSEGVTKLAPAPP
jgi:signal transduction histidine kinase/ActR/RegA family two-component response regulator